MATHGFAGLFVKLKNRSVSLVDRLKLLRFAWKSSDVFIPNKEQALIDLLGSYLLDQKKDQLSSEDVALVWECLRDVLGTRRMQGARDQQKELAVKQSLAQLMADSLAAEAEGRQPSLRSTVVSCCQSVITSPILTHLFTARLDIMLSLICSLVKLEGRGAGDDDTARLLTSLVHKYLKGLRTAPQQNQILQTMCDKFVPVLIPVWSQSPSSCIQKAGMIFLAAFTHKDHQHGLTLFLQTATSQKDEKVNKRAKMASHVFATLEKFLQGQTADSMVYYLCEMFNYYINRNCHEGNLQTSFNLLVQLCHLIGLRRDSAALCGLVAPPAVVRGGQRLLEVVWAQELYSVTADEGNRQLGFYRHLAKLLLGIDCFSSNWFSCFTILLQLNHNIVEPFLADMLGTGWLGDKARVPGDTLAALDKFLDELVLTYSKLRQMPKLVNKLLDCLCGCHGNNASIPMTPRFFKRFGEMAQSLPQGSLVDIWKTFVQRLKGTFIGGDDQLTLKGHFQGVVSLMHHFIMNIRLYDYSVTEITSQNVREIMVAMETDILSPLLKSQLERKEVQEGLVSTLHLCYTWGEVLAMLAQYKSYRASQLQTCEVAMGAQDLSYLHSYLDSEQWRSLHKKVRKGNSAALLYVWDMLLVQKVRTILLLRDTKDWTAAKDIMAKLVTLPEDLTETVATATWSKAVTDVTEENAAVARWQLLTTSLGSIQCAVTPDQLQAIARWTLVTHGCPQSEQQDHTTVGEVSRGFLQSPWVRECPVLLSQLITTALTAVKNCFSGAVPKGKKRKSSSGLASFLLLLDTLTTEELDWTRHSDSEVQEKTLEAGKCLGAVLGDTQGVGRCLGAVYGDTEGPRGIPAYVTLDSCLQVLESLPLEEMVSCDQIRCLTGLLSLLAVLNRCSSLSGKEAADRQALTDKCVALCTVLLESCSPARVFSVIDIQLFLSWLATLSVTCDKEISFHRVLLLTMLACEAVLKLKDIEKLEKLVPWVNQCFEDLSSLEEDVLGKFGLFCMLLESVTKALTRAYLRDDMKTVCTAIYSALSARLLQLPPLLSNLDRATGGRDRAALLVYCYCSTVRANFVTAEMKEAFVERFPGLLHWCTDVLQHTSGSSTLFEKMAALNFLYSISKFHTGIDSVYTESFKLNTWLLLVGVLKNMLISQSQTSIALQTDSSQSQTGSNLQQQCNSQSQKTLVSSHTPEKQTSQSQLSSDLKKSNRKGKSSVSECVSIDRKEKVNRILNILQINKTVDEEKEIQQKVTEKLIKTHVKDVTVDCDAGVMQYSAISQWYSCLVFEGRLDDSEDSLLLALVQNVMATHLACLHIQQFDRIVHTLVEDVHSNRLLTDTTTVRSSLYIWRQLLQLDFSQDQTDVLKKSAKTMMLNMQCIVQQLQHCRDEATILDILVPILNTQRQILTRPQKFLRSQVSLLCLHSCAYAPLGGSTYFPVFHAVCDVLDALLVHHEKPVLESIPAFIGCAKKLLLSVVDQSDQAAVSHDPEIVEGLKGCAYEMERLFTLISNHKVEFGKVATYVVADYVTAVQKVTLIPAIKRALVPAVYKMLDLCDSHAVAQLHTVLSHGVIDVFKLLYHEYVKFHKYTGKI